MTEILTAQPMEVPQLTPEQDQEIYWAINVLREADNVKSTNNKGTI